MCAVQRFILSHELIQEDFKGVHPNFDRGLSPVPLLLPHGLFQDLLKQSVEIFVADALTIVHLMSKEHRIDQVAMETIIRQTVRNSCMIPYRQGCGIGVEDIQTEFLQCFFEYDVHHGVLLAVLRVQVVDLSKTSRVNYV